MRTEGVRYRKIYRILPNNKLEPEHLETRVWGVSGPVRIQEQNRTNNKLLPALHDVYGFRPRETRALAHPDPSDPRSSATNRAETTVGPTSRSCWRAELAVAGWRRVAPSVCVDGSDRSGETEIPAGVFSACGASVGRVNDCCLAAASISGTGAKALGTVSLSRRLL